MNLIVLLLPLVLWAGFQEAPPEDLYNQSKKNSRPKKPVRVKKNNKLDDKIMGLIEQDQIIAEILRKSEKNTIVKKSSPKVLALTRVKGVLLNSVIAMNVKPSKFIVRISDEREELEDGEIRCLGYSFQKRVPAHCDLLVIDDQEYKIDVDIWDLDGAEGIIADYFYSGEEKAFLTSSFASFLQGVLNVAKDRISGPFGQVTKSNAKNTLLGGLSSVAENAGKKIVQSGERKLSMSFVNSGKEVLVFFNQTLKLVEE